MEVATVSFVGDLTESPPFEFNDYTQRVIVASLFLMVSLAGTIGNSLVILAVVLSKKLRTTTNTFVVNLSLADLVSCFMIPWSAVALLGRDDLPFHKWVCSMVSVIHITTFGCSVYTLASISINRLLLITRPADTYRVIYAPKKIVVWLAVTWLIPLIVTILPPLLGAGELGYDEMYHICSWNSRHSRSKDGNRIVAAALYPLPLTTIVVCYIMIWRHVKPFAKRITRSSERPSKNTSDNLLTVSKSEADTSSNAKSSPTDNGSVKRSHAYTSRQHQVTKNIFYVVCAFVLCMTPLAICFLHGDSKSVLPYATVILFFNSCVNPVIYATKHRDFKIVFGCILQRRWGSIPEPSEFLKTLRRAKCCERGRKVRGK